VILVWKAAEMARPMSVALTFDDGYLHHADIARILYRIHVKATFFLITGRNRWEQQKPLLTQQPDLIREMRAMKHEIASHTHLHPNLLSLTDEEIDRELRESKRYLEDLLHQEVNGFSYPYGKFDDRVRSLVEKHYSYARIAEEIDPSRENKYQIPIRRPSKNLAHTSLLITKDKFMGRGFDVLLFHLIPIWEVVLLTTYLKSIGVNFLTLRELVNAKYDLSN
jgi:peptidoglycan/xylan/chitin deacetylase (PgdA/CDA1 family)